MLMKLSSLDYLGQEGEKKKKERGEGRKGRGEEKKREKGGKEKRGKKKFHVELAHHFITLDHSELLIFSLSSIFKT